MMKQCYFILLVILAVASSQADEWKLAWSDEFNQAGPPDPAKWDYETGFVRNNEAQFYTRARPENARVENGLLIIEARKEQMKNPAFDPAAKERGRGGRSREFAEYTSASLMTRGKASWTYGRIEVRAKLPSGRGAWPAIWTLGANRQAGWPACGEIDIMEFVGYEPEVIHANFHTKKYNHVLGNGQGGKIKIPKVSEDFHVYAIEWHPDHIDSFVDDQKYFTYRNEGTGSDSWPFDKDQYLILNLAIGGAWGGQKGIDDGIFPQRFCIDYVRVYQKPAADWPRWGGPAGNGHVPLNMAMPETLPAEPKVMWRTPIGHGLGSPVVSGGKVFYLDNQQGQETVQAVDATTGKALWSQPLDEAFKDTQSAAGPRGTPVVDGDRVYAQSCRGEFQCLQAKDGKLLWRINFVKDFDAFFLGESGSASGASRHGYTGSPVVEGDRLFAGVGGTNGAGMVCFDKRNGTVIWKSQKDVPGHSGPVMATLAGVKQAISFTADGVIGLDAQDGALLWRVPVQTRLGRHAVTPVVVEDMVVVSSYQAGLMGLKISRDGDAVKAERAWANKALGINIASPVAVGPYLYGLGPGRKLICVDVKTGEKTWTKEDGFSSPFEKDYAAMLVMKDRILTLGFNGQLLLFAADPKEYRQIGSAQVCGNTWCNPAYTDGRFYIRSEKELLCVQLIP